MSHETQLLDLGEWGNGPEDPYTAPEDMKAVLAAGNVDRKTYRIVVRVPPTWSLRKVERRLERMLFQDVVVSRRAVIWAAL